MGLHASDKGNGQDFEPIEAGLHHAICYAIFDLGHQLNRKYDKHQHKVLINWELPEERIVIKKDDGPHELPRAISRQYTLSLSKKAYLRKDLETWRGRNFTPAELEKFDLTKLLGVNCTLQIMHNNVDDKTYANVAAVVPLQKHLEKKEPENPLKYFSFEEGRDIPDGVPEWIVKIIHNSLEWQEPENECLDGPPNDMLPDFEDPNDIPF
jgi:hypothetical protein